MNNLIKNEIIKLVKKKSFIVLLFTLLFLTILSNCFYKYIYIEENDSDNYSYLTDEYMTELRTQKLGYEMFESIDNANYIDVVTEIKVAEYIRQFNGSAWKQEMAAHYLYEPCSNIVFNTYSSKDTNRKEIIKENEVKIQEILAELKADNWKYFANKELEIKEKDLIGAKRELDNSPENAKEAAKSNVYLYEASVQVLKWRISNNISYEESYRNTLLNKYVESSSSVYYYDANSEEKDQNYYTNLEDIKTTEYIMNNDIKIESSNDARSILERFYGENELILIIIIIIYAAGMLSEEFNKGTIKSLLIRPHSRTKVLLSKFIALVIIMLLFIIAMMVMQFFVGGILLGFESLGVPIIKYNFTTNSIMELNIFKYLLIETLYRLPLLFILMVIAFTLGTIFNSASLATIFTLLIYLTYPFINTIFTVYNVKVMKYYITLNWNLEQYMFGRLPEIIGGTFGSSLSICIIYFVVILGIAIINFKNRNIKNI